MKKISKIKHDDIRAELGDLDSSMQLRTPIGKYVKCGEVFTLNRLRIM